MRLSYEPIGLSAVRGKAMQSDDDFRKFIQARHWRFAKTMP